MYEAKLKQPFGPIVIHLNLFPFKMLGVIMPINRIVYCASPTRDVVIQWVIH